MRTQSTPAPAYCDPNQRSGNLNAILTICRTPLQPALKSVHLMFGQLLQKLRLSETLRDTLLILVGRTSAGLQAFCRASIALPLQWAGSVPVQSFLHLFQITPQSILLFSTIFRLEESPSRAGAGSMPCRESALIPDISTMVLRFFFRCLQWRGRYLIITVYPNYCVPFFMKRHHTTVNHTPRPLILDTKASAFPQRLCTVAFTNSRSDTAHLFPRLCVFSGVFLTKLEHEREYFRIQRRKEGSAMGASEMRSSAFNSFRCRLHCGRKSERRFHESHAPGQTTVT